IGGVMQRVYQTKFGETEGNCFAACLASLFPVTLENVPDFYELAGGRWYNAFVKWMEQFDLVPMMFSAEVHTPALEVFHLMGGVSPRGIPHNVVGFKGQMVHDPHPDGL